MAPINPTSRDAGLALISRINRWMIAAAVAFAGAVSLLAARSFRGHTASSAIAGSRSTPSSGSSGVGSSSSGVGSSSSGLSSPSQVPSPSSSSSSDQAPVVSGGS
jgi:hypothetical protein